MYRSMFSSLWWVMKGLAVAPPGIMFIKGVSTYKQRNSSSVVTLDFDLLTRFALFPLRAFSHTVNKTRGFIYR